MDLTVHFFLPDKNVLLKEQNTPKAFDLSSTLQLHKSQFARRVSISGTEIGAE
jgi:hypothetical protein